MSDSKKEELDMAGVPFSDATACAKEKIIHDQCFYKWYQEHLVKADGVPLECGEEWAIYQGCLDRKMKAFDLLEDIQQMNAPPFDIRKTS